MRTRRSYSAKGGRRWSMTTKGNAFKRWSKARFHGYAKGLSGKRRRRY